MKSDLKSYLDQKADEYNQASFIESDPILIPHQFSKKEDIEIIGFLVSTIAWGKRKSIIKNGFRLIDLLENRPFDFILEHSDFRPEDYPFVHRTFNSGDLAYFLRSLRNLYLNHGGLEGSFSHGATTKERIVNFRKLFLETEPDHRAKKHVSNPETGSAAKRLNMFLRWMVRQDQRGVDFGIWKNFPVSELMIPLDVHTGNVARELGILKRNANDWKALEELMSEMQSYDRNDPCRYDFALFGIGVNKDLKIEKIVN